MLFLLIYSVMSSENVKSKITQSTIYAVRLKCRFFFFFSQTLLTMGRTIQDSVDEMGTRIYTALKKVIYGLSFGTQV